MHPVIILAGEGNVLCCDEQEAIESLPCYAVDETVTEVLGSCQVMSLLCELKVTVFCVQMLEFHIISVISNY